MELGPIQKEWIKSLKKHPERQNKYSLGIGTPEDYKVCCLGEYLVCYNKAMNLPNPFKNGIIIDGDIKVTQTLVNSYRKLGLYGSTGVSKHGYEDTLATLNDVNLTWPEIAELIEKDPSEYLNKSI